MKIDLSRFELIFIEKVLTYEKISEKRVFELMENIQQTSQLENPVLWDKNLKLLIDGRHRSQALRLLGINHIPGYHINYNSQKVKVRNWFRAINFEDSEKAVQFFNSVKIFSQTNLSKKSWKNILMNKDGKIAQLDFHSPFEAAENLHWLCEKAAFEGYKCVIIPLSRVKEIVNSGKFILYLDPIIGKTEVIESAMSNRKFVHQVNRHLIDLRPVGIDLPINILKLPEKIAKKKMVKHLTGFKCQLIEGTTWKDDRLYEERLLQLFRL